MRKAVWFIILSLLAAACGATVEPPPPVTVRVSAADGAVGLVNRAAESFSRANPHLTFEISQANAVRSLARLAAGEVDLAIVPALPSGAEQFRQTPIARDGLAIIVHPGNPVNNLTLLELRRLYSGNSLNWRDVQGGTELDVQAAVRERGAGIEAIFEEMVMQGGRITPNARVFPNSRAMLDFVAQTPGAIGFVSAAQSLDGVKVVAVEDISPAPETTASGAYPLTHLLVALTAPTGPAAAQDFVNFLLRPAGQEIIAAGGLGRVR